MSKEIKVTDFIGESARFDEFGGGYIWGEQTDGSEQMIAEVRGYGAIQQLFISNKRYDIESADKFQDEIGKFIAEAITEKIQRMK